MKLDPKSVRAIAKEAVKKVYQHGSSKKDERFREQRRALARTFREKYGSNNEEGRANAVPYFVGVWDTVAALGASWPRLIGFGVALLAVSAAVIWGISFLLDYLLPGTAGKMTTWLSFLAPWFRSWPTSFTLFNYLLAAVLGASAAIFLIWYLATHIKFATGTGDPIYKTLHMTLWGLQFADKTLDDRVRVARHAMSIDENRKDFARVKWANSEGIHERAPGEMIWFEQVWFAGNHSDVGGSYPENEARLSDISLGWMVNEARRCVHPILVDETYLKLYPDCAGMQHDERKSSRVPWKLGLREVPAGAFLHPSVFDRLALAEVLNYDTLGKYDPEPLRGRTYNRYEVIKAPSNPR
jgi:hypothetical protein